MATGDADNNEQSQGRGLRHLAHVKKIHLFRVQALVDDGQHLTRRRLGRFAVTTSIMFGQLSELLGEPLGYCNDSPFARVIGLMIANRCGAAAHSFQESALSP
jgi:hypothetical protein